ncbi:MAG: ABC transporter substrate-binding protein [Candidatus Korobacteraceae bacterium]|jgi:NitT/TauT family transport system substrate-binding protein
MCVNCGINRRDFLKLTSTLSAGALVGLFACHKAVAEQPVRIGYLAITDATPLLVAHSRGLYKAEGLTVDQPRLFRSWAQLSEAFLARQVNVVHMLMPATIWIRYARKFPAKVVAWNHTNGSALTVLPGISSVADLGGKTVAIPFWYSVHNVLLQRVLREAGMTIVTKPKEAALAKNEVNLTILPPADMISALANKSIAGYIVAEPFNAVAEDLKIGKIMRFSGDIWRDHACCVVFMHEDDLRERKQWSQAVVNSIVSAQAWSRDNRPGVAEILSKDGGKYTPHTKEVLDRALGYYDPAFYGASGAIHHVDWPIHRIDFQPYPFPSYTQELVKFLKETRVEGDTAFLAGLDPSSIATDLVDTSFVTDAIRAAGGPASFGIPPSFTRSEVIRI